MKSESVLLRQMSHFAPYHQQLTKAIPIERNGLNTQYAQALRFKNSMIVNENDIDQLRQAQATNDPNLLAEILNHIYQDQAKLGVRAHYTREKLIMQALTTGKLLFQDNGVYSAVNCDNEFFSSL